jgi:prevent-host-death family protein
MRVGLVPFETAPDVPRFVRGLVALRKRRELSAEAHAGGLIRLVLEVREPVIVTQNGEAEAVLQDIASYDAPWIASGTPVRPRWKSVDQQRGQPCTAIRWRPRASARVRS